MARQSGYNKTNVLGQLNLVNWCN